MISHLSEIENIRLTNAIFISLIGNMNYRRWRNLKLRLNFESERHFVSWILDALECVKIVGSDGNEDCAAPSYEVKQHDKDDNEDDGNIWSLVDNDKNEEHYNFIAEPTCETKKDQMLSKLRKQNITSKNRGVGGKGHFCNQCVYCAAIFKRPAELHRHMSIHTGSRGFPCPHKECNGREFSRRDNLDSHLIHAHTSLRPYPCPYCDKKFKTGKELRAHEKKHTSSSRCKVFGCGSCSKTFETYQKAKLHVNSTHRFTIDIDLDDIILVNNEKVGGVEETLYRCTECALTSINIHDVKTHKCKGMQILTSAKICDNKQLVQPHVNSQTNPSILSENPAMDARMITKPPLPLQQAAGIVQNDQIMNIQLQQNIHQHQQPRFLQPSGMEHEELGIMQPEVPATAIQGQCCSSDLELTLCQLQQQDEEESCSQLQNSGAFHRNDAGAAVQVAPQPFTTELHAASLPDLGVDYGDVLETIQNVVFSIGQQYTTDDDL